jgi:hypothetical protein
VEFGDQMALAPEARKALSSPNSGASVRGMPPDSGAAELAAGCWLKTSAAAASEVRTAVPAPR